jgi:hypothetical protein
MTFRALRLGAIAILGAASCTGTVIGHDTPGGTGNKSGGSGGISGTGNTPGTGAGPGSGTGGSSTPSGTGGSIVNPTGTGGDPGTSVGTPAKLNLQGSPAYLRFVRLSNEQWANSVKEILALSTPAADLTTGFQNAVSGTTDFTNNELVLSMDDRSTSDFRTSIETVAAQVTATDAALAKVYTGTDAAGFINAIGRRAYRRPLTAAEKTTYMTLFSSGANLTGTRSAFAKGASLVIRAMLQSPFFLYRNEMGANGSALTGYEMAAKISLWLKNSTPNDALLDSAAGPGKLETPDGAVMAAKALLEDPAAVPVMRKFHSEFLHFDRFSQLSKVGVSNYTAALNDELAESSALFFDKIFKSNLGLKDVFKSTSGFVSPAMAKLYGGNVAAPTSGYAERDLGATRTGYFSQLPFLALYGDNADPNPIKRGAIMNIDVLCATLGPPSNILPELAPLKPGQTNRQRVDASTVACGMACHNQMINPIGFAFEKFDGMGQYRETEKNGNDNLPIDTSGTYNFVEGVKSFAGAPELMQVLADGQQAHLCYAKKLASFGLQRYIVEKDMPLLTTLAATSASSNGSVKQVMLDLIKNDAFRTRVGGGQ